MEKNWDIIELLRHSRHDWLNHIQLIQGYMYLDDKDKVSQLIEKIVQQSNQATAISNLSMEKFVSYILTFHWESPVFVLDYEVEGTVRNLSAYDKELYAFTTLFFAEVKKNIVAFAENHMTITFEIKEDDVAFYFDFRGKLTTYENVGKWLTENQELEHFTVSDFHVSEEEIAVTVS